MSEVEVVVLTGAGISAESGLPTFRGQDGLWEGHRVEDLASPRAFQRQPELVQKFYNMRRRRLLSPEVQPNAAHRALAAAEASLGDRWLLVTQNVDDLHQRAGSQRVLPMHGELLKARHCRTGEVREIRDDLAGTEWRPHIVWFGEMPLHMETIVEALRQCRLFVAIGTSGRVYPAADFVRIAANGGAETVEINLAASAQHSHFDIVLQGPATDRVPAFVRERFPCDLA